MVVRSSIRSSGYCTSILIEVQRLNSSSVVFHYTTQNPMGVLVAGVACTEMWIRERIPGTV